MTDPFFRNEGDLLVRRMPNAPVPFALFENRVPTPRQAKRILRRGYGLHLLGVPDSDKGLEVLRQFDGLEHLAITSRALDLRPLASLSSLVSLSLTALDSESVDLSVLRRLESFDGELEGNESVLGCPRLIEAMFADIETDELPPIPAQLRKLTLSGAPRVRGIRPANSSPQLREFHIVSARRFDLATLSPFVNLTYVSFASVAHLANATALARLSLTDIGLIRCREIEPVDALAALGPATSVTVVGKLGEKVQDLAAKSPATWHFYRTA